MTTPTKIIELEPLFEQTDEPRIVTLQPRGRNNYKYASESVLDYCRTIQSQPGKHYVLVLAMSASEYYGPNKNGDAFAERPVYGANNQCLISADEVLPVHHSSFERMGNVFVHHLNKDPSKNYGKVVKSFYNFNMHRVELLLEIDEQKASGQFFLHKIQQGEFPGVSMGCKIKYDVCSICGNKAPTRKQYCNHVNNRDPNFGMNRLLEDGQMAFVWNPSPGLFDISFVWKPADHIGFMMKKVAEAYAVRSSWDLGEAFAKTRREKAAVDKLSEIDKAIEGEVGATGDGAHAVALNHTFKSTPSCSMEPIPVSTAKSCAPYALQDVLASMCVMGMPPTAKDIYRLISAQMGVEPDPRYEVMAGSMQGGLLDIFSDNPHLIEDLLDLPGARLDTATPVPALCNKLAEEMPGRALFLDKFMRDNVPESYGAPIGTMLGIDPTKVYYENTTSPLTYVNPETGKTYETNRRAAELADTANKKRLAAEAAGAAGLLGVAYKSMTASGKLKYLQPAALGGAGVLGYDIVKGQRVPRLKTQEGEYVPVNTEFVEKRSNMMRDAVTPLGAGAIATYMLSQDGLLPQDSPEAQSLAAFTSQNPVLSTLGLGTVYAGLRDLSKAGLTRLRKQASLASDMNKQVSLDDVINGVMTILNNSIQ